MPSIDIQVMAGVFDNEDKARIIREVTDAFGRAAGGRMGENTSVRIHEVAPGSWGYAGSVLTLEDALAIKAGR